MSTPETLDPDALPQFLSALVTREGAQPSCLPGVNLLRLTRPHLRAPVVYEPSIIFVVQGKKVGYLGNEVYHYDPQNYLVLSVPLPFECATDASPEKPLLAVSLQVDPVLLGELLLEMDDGAPFAAQVPRGMYSTPMSAPLRDAVARLLKCLACPAESRILGKAIVREIIYRVLLSERGGALRAVAARHSQFSRIAKVLRRIHVDYLQPFDVESLAREANMSVSTFHHVFKSVTSAPPLQYIKSIRLHKARLLIAQEGIKANVAATRVGYESHSQFSREFKRFFGVSPAAEALRMRGIQVAVSASGSALQQRSA